MPPTIFLRVPRDEERRALLATRPQSQSQSRSQSQAQASPSKAGTGSPSKLASLRAAKVESGTAAGKGSPVSSPSKGKNKKGLAAKSDAASLPPSLTTKGKSGSSKSKSKSTNGAPPLRGLDRYSHAMSTSTSTSLSSGASVRGGIAAVAEEDEEEEEEDDECIPETPSLRSTPTMDGVDSTSSSLSSLTASMSRSSSRIFDDDDDEEEEENRAKGKGRGGGKKKKGGKSATLDDDEDDEDGSSRATSPPSLGEGRGTPVKAKPTTTTKKIVLTSKKQGAAGKTSAVIKNSKGKGKGKPAPLIPADARSIISISSDSSEANVGVGGDSLASTTTTHTTTTTANGVLAPPRLDAPPADDEISVPSFARASSNPTRDLGRLFEAVQAARRIAVITGACAQLRGGSDESKRFLLEVLADTMHRSHFLPESAGAGISVSAPASIPDFRSSQGLFAKLKEQHPNAGLSSGKDLFDARLFKVSGEINHGASHVGV